MSDRLRTLIADGRVHVLDGAMGTVMYTRGVFVNVCYDELSDSQPDLVRGVHEAYVSAGAEILETNTFGANPVKLSAFGLDERTEALNRRAAQLARDAAGDRVAVVGAIGPLGIRIEPWGPTSREDAIGLFERQVAGLLEGGVDGFILETFNDVDELYAAFRAARRLSDLPVIAQMSLNEEGSTAYGAGVEAVTEAISGWPPDVIGLNCSVGPSAMLDALERMAALTDLPLSALPNAGQPRDVGDRKIYLASPDYMARYARRMVDAGVRFIGGCCGTTPEHIRLIVEQIGELSPRPSRAFMPRADVHAETDRRPVPLAERSGLGARLAAGDFVTTAEVVPPHGWDVSEMLSDLRDLTASQVNAVNLPDGPRSQSRMSALTAGIILHRELGLEPVVHYTCRDRTMLGMMSDLLGAAAAGIRNLLLVTGDPPRSGPYDTTGVYEIDSIGLTNLAYRLNHGLDPGGGSIGDPTPFVIGVAVNPWSIDLETELRRFYWKVDAGADFAVTQPVFDADGFLEFLGRVEDYGIPVVAGITPLASLRNAEFLSNEVPGMVVPDDVMARMARADEDGEEAARAEGVAIAREVLDRIATEAAGVMLSASGGALSGVLEVLGGPPASRT